MQITPPLLERLARRDELVELVNAKVKVIRWGGAHLDPDSRYLYRTEIFPEVKLFGAYGSTMMLGFAGERSDLTDDDPCIFDPMSPYVTFQVVDPELNQPVAHGERGQVIVNFMSKSFLLPNNLERDLVTRIEGPAGQTGDSVADVAPVRTLATGRHRGSTDAQCGVRAHPGGWMVQIDAGARGAFRSRNRELITDVAGRKSRS
jgi:hypothetical protein